MRASALVALFVFSFGMGTAARSDSLPTAKPEKVGLSSERLERLDRHFDAYVDAGKLAGFQLAVARRGRHRPRVGPALPAMRLQPPRPLGTGVPGVRYNNY